MHRRGVRGKEAAMFEAVKRFGALLKGSPSELARLQLPVHTRYKLL